MTASREALAAVRAHWALEAIGPSRVGHAHAVAQRLYVQANVGQFGPGEDADVADLELLRRVALAYEVVTSEGLADLVSGPASDPARSDLAEAGAYWAFDIRRALPFNRDELEPYLFSVLQLGALGYCSDRWAEFRAWLRDRQVTPDDLPPSSADGWDVELLRAVGSMWIRLLRKEGWADLAAVGEGVLELRRLQDEREPTYLTEANEDGLARTRAWRITALYHWARATELLAQYLMQGSPTDAAAQLTFHYERAIKAAEASFDSPFEVLLRWMHVLARRMASGSLWSLASIGDDARRLVEAATSARGMFELLPPQRVALLEQGLLDPASAAVVVDLPTSAGKTILAEFRIVQALNQFAEQRGWVAYVAPTRALVAQLTRRLRRDLAPLEISVEQLSAAVELDELEQELVAAPTASFDVLVTTPEKLSLLLRNGVVPRPLVLLVLDEAHNIEDDERGVRIELLLATAKRDCPQAKFLLLMPNVPNGDEVARWLAPDSGRSVSLGTSAWQPNDRLVGLVQVSPPPTGRGRQWSLQFTTLVTSANTLVVDRPLAIGSGPTLDKTYSAVRGSLSLIAGAAARAFSQRGTSVVVARTIPDVWSTANAIAESLPTLDSVDEDIALTQRFLATEISPQFALVQLLNAGIGVHHAGLSDEARALMEWLAETGKLRTLVATTSIAQGLNFPVSSVFLASRQVPRSNSSTPMSTRSFWNLAGRAGRVDQDSIGVVGLACRDEDVGVLSQYVSDATGDLVSRLVTMINDLDARGQLLNLERIMYADQWADFRSYVAHLYNQHATLDAVLAEAELLLRNTYGYSQLSESDPDRRKGQVLLAATKSYAESLAQHPENAALADSTGFAPESVRDAMLGLTRLPERLSTSDWEPSSLFAGVEGTALPDLLGVLMKVPQVRDSIEELTAGRSGDSTRAAEIVTDWVQGRSIQEIATNYFDRGDGNITRSLTDACRVIYRSLSMAGTWGISALSKMPTSGIDFESLPDDARRRINLIGAMMYHGVSTEGGVMMRMASVPRTVADPLGAIFFARSSQDERRPPIVRDFLRDLPASEWSAAAPSDATMDGNDYRRVWGLLSGES